MRKEDLKVGIWFRRHLHEFDTVIENATYLREGKYNFMLLRMNDRAMLVPRDSLEVITDDSGEITGVHMKLGYSRYQGISIDDLDDYPLEKMHSMVYGLASKQGALINQETYDLYRVTENSKNLPVIDFHHHSCSDWIRYRSEKILSNIEDKSEDFKHGFDYAVTQARIWVLDVIEEPGTTVIDGETGETYVVE